MIFFKGVLAVSVIAKILVKYFILQAFFFFFPLFFFLVLQLPYIRHLIMPKICLHSYCQPFNEMQVDLLGIGEKVNSLRTLIGKSRTIGLLSHMLVYSSSFSCLLQSKL